MPSLPYEEPGIITILIQSSFLFLLNIISSVLDRLLYCGLLGQILLGIAWGLPGGNLLSLDAQHFIVELGYIGLILLVYEGGLSVPIASLKANIALSMCVAITGIALPIALSFVLVPLMQATPLQAFTAGAALCSTSLGTTFTVLSTSGLANTRLGTVLSTAAMIDDVIGLVIVQVISNLGSEDEAIAPSVVIRPLLVSLAFAVVVPLTCRYIVRKVRIATAKKSVVGKIRSLCQHKESRLMFHMLLLLGLVAAGSYAGTSNLFTAYLAGAVVNWWDSHKLEDPSLGTPRTVTGTPAGAPAESPAGTCTSQVSPGACTNRELQGSRTGTPQLEYLSGDLSGRAIYKTYLAQPVDRVLKPFFFASIGFSIPIASLFTGSLVWRGIVYTMLMAFGKLVCGFWLVRLPLNRSSISSNTKRWQRFCNLTMGLLRGESKQPTATQQDQPQEPANETPAPAQTAHKTADAARGKASMPPTVSTGRKPPKEAKAPLSLYPATMLGSAMVARGEIGFLIASVAESNGIWRQDQSQRQGDSSTIFIVVTWAIFLCTFIGPVAVGTIVRRVRALEKRRKGSGRDTLGVWGINVR